MSKLKLYRKKETQLMFPWFPLLKMDDISVSEADKANGSPKLGDMIAINLADPTDQWLVAEKFFKENYEEVETDA